MNIIDYDYQGFNNSGKWIITSYEITREKDKTFSDAFFKDKLPLTKTPVKDIMLKIQII